MTKSEIRETLENMRVEGHGAVVPDALLIEVIGALSE